MDAILKICNELEKCDRRDICNNNKIVCVKHVLKRYVGDDYNRLLEIKAQISIHDNICGKTQKNISFVMSLSAFGLSALNLYFVKTSVIDVLFTLFLVWIPMFFIIVANC